LKLLVAEALSSSGSTDEERAYAKRGGSGRKSEKKGSGRKSEKQAQPKQQSVAQKFRGQLQTLMGKLAASTALYVRCVKTNHTKTPRHFDEELCLRQLRYAGVFEAVTIRKQGYPYRFAIHSPHSSTLSHSLLSFTLLIHSSHTLLSYTLLIHSSHTLLSYTPLIHSSHTLLSYTPLIHSSHQQPRTGSPSTHS
jgi:hypothetical protein